MISSLFIPQARVEGATRTAALLPLDSLSLEEEDAPTKCIGCCSGIPRRRNVVVRGGFRLLL